MLLDSLNKKGLLQAPPYVISNCHYLTIMGSHAYGVADTSVKEKIPDYDVYGFCIPPKNYLFPHLRGEIPGFGTLGQKFEQYQKHGIIDDDFHEWDINVYNIVKFFELCRQNNPNMIDSLFTMEYCLLHCTQVGRMVKDKRKMFLCKESWKKFRGYAWAQLHKLQSKEPEGARREITDKFGYDVKFAYHVVRLLDEAEQILINGDIDLQRAREPMKAIRRGEWKIEDVQKWAIDKAAALETAYANCKLPVYAPELELKNLLLECLEHHYGKIDNITVQANWAIENLREIDRIISKNRNELYG